MNVNLLVSKYVVKNICMKYVIFIEGYNTTYPSILLSNFVCYILNKYYVNFPINIIYLHLIKYC